MNTSNSSSSCHDPRDYRRALEGTLGIPFTAGNRIERLVNGLRIFPAMIETVAAAQSSIDFLTFIYWQGEIAERFGHALAERARAGVRVRILLDSFGAHSMPKDVLAELEQAGAQIAWFRPAVRWRFWQADNRTHRKILVVDNRIGFTGGVGIAAEWDGDAREPNEWRETHFRLTGPVVDGLRGAFLSNWVEAGERGFDDSWTFSDPEITEEKNGALIQVLRTSAAVNYSDIATLFRLVISLARHRLRITTGYFVPDTATIDMLCNAARRGVEIEVLMPGPYTDSRVARAAADDAYQPLLEAGVKLYRYQPTMLHAKIVLVDDVVAISGSANFNHRSMGKDDEIAIAMIDPPTFAALDTDFDDDRARCHQVTLENWQKRGVFQRIKEYLSRILKPQA